MSKKSKINLSHVAKLANLPLTSQEVSTYEKQIEEILKYVEQLESVNTSNVKPTFNVTPNNNITRDDVVNTGLTQDQVLENVSTKKDGFVVTKGIFENE